MPFDLVKLLGQGCLSLALDSTEDQEKINKLFIDKMLQARRGMDSLKADGYISDEDLLVAVSFMEFVEEFAYKFHLIELQSWAICQYTMLNHLTYARKIK